MAYFLGIEFHKFEKGLLVHKKRYALEIFKKFDMEHCNVDITPEELITAIKNTFNLRRIEDLTSITQAR